MDTHTYAPFKSFVDAPFFSELGKWKLNEAQLSEEVLTIRGSSVVPAAPDRGPIIRFSSWSCGTSNDVSVEHSMDDYFTDGELLNLNTLEQFKRLDKKEFHREVLRDLVSRIETGAALKDPRLLTRFKVLSYMDLKKYKFYYWFLFPALRIDLHVKSLSDPASADLNAQIHKLHEPFFSIINGVVCPVATDADSFGMVDFGTTNALPWNVTNFAALLKSSGVSGSIKVYLYRDRPSVAKLVSRWIEIDLDSIRGEWNLGETESWERNSQGKLLPKIADMGALMNPLVLADQAVDLNLRLMKWRVARTLDLDAVKNARCLLLGAGTLGCYVARGLLAWGVRTITFVDSGSVSYSNPVRQPLFTHEDAVAGEPKAKAAAISLKKIFPGVNTEGVVLEIPMAGHPITDEARQRHYYHELEKLIEAHDYIFLLMDSRESRWLPTVMAQGLRRPVINVAIGFDSYLVMRHGIPASPEESKLREEQDRSTQTRLGCYFCNDVVAPIDSLWQLTLDQMCTVTRPGVAMLASAQAVELLAQICQHPLGCEAEANAETALGPMPHQLRGHLSNHQALPVWGPAFPRCSGCSPVVVDEWKERKWDFVVEALNDTEYLSELCGLGELQRQTDALELDEFSETDEFS